MYIQGMLNFSSSIFFQFDSKTMELDNGSALKLWASLPYEVSESFLEKDYLWILFWFVEANI